MIQPGSRRLLRWTLWSLLGLIALAAIGLFVAPRLIDLPAVQTRVEAEVSRMVQGQVTWDSLRVSLLPVPHAVLRGARIAIPELLQGRVDEIDVDLALGALLRGRVEIDRVRVLRPMLRLTLAPSDRTPPPQGTPIEIYRRAMTPVVKAVRAVAPAIAISIEDAGLEVIAPGLPAPLKLRLTLHAGTNATGMTLKATASGPLAKSLRADARVAFADLAGQATIEASGLAPQSFIDQLLAGAPVALQCPDGSLKLDAQTDGKTIISATAGAAVPTLTVSRGTGMVDLSPVKIDAAASARGRDIELHLTAVELGHLIPAATAQLRFSGGGESPVVTVDIPALDLMPARDAVLALLDDTVPWRTYIDRLHTGQVANVRASAKAPTLAALFESPAVDAALDATNGTYLAPFIERDVSDIGGHVEWSGGALAVRGAIGHVADAVLSDVSYDYRPGDGDMSGAGGYDTDLAATLGIVRPLLQPAQRAVLNRISALRGRANGTFGFALQSGQWRGDIAVARSDATLRIREIPWPVSLRQGRVAMAPGRVQIAGVAGAVGQSTVDGAGVDLTLIGPVRIDGARGSARLSLDELYPWLRQQKGLAAASSAIPSVTGKVDVNVVNVVGRPDAVESLDYDMTIQPHRVNVAMTGLPAPVMVDGGSIGFKREAVRIDGVGASLLDANARLTGGVADYRSKAIRADIAIADGSVGEAIMGWTWRRAALPVRFEPAAPIRLPTARLRWSREAGVDVQANLRAGKGVNVDADVAAKPGALNVRSLRLHDGESDVTIGLLTRGRLLDIRFAGKLAGRSLESLLKTDSGKGEGRVTGDFRATIDRDAPERAMVSGSLKGRQIDLRRLIRKPLVVEQIDLDADGTRVRMHLAILRWAEQKATIRGELRRSADGAVLDADIDSPGIDVAALVAQPGTTVGESAGEPVATVATDTPPWRGIWPLPLTGTLNVRAGFVQYQRYRAAPVAAKFVLEHERVHVTATEVAVCGISFPFVADLTLGGVVASVALEAKDRQLEATVRCLSEESALVTGTFDLRGELHTEGRRDELIDHLAGTLEVRIHEGEIRKLALLGNILALKNVTKLFSRGVPNIGSAGFHYREITATGSFGGGKFTLEQGALDSDAMGLVANGTVGLRDERADLTVLVAPFGSLDRLVRRLPLFGYVIGGALTSIPVGVSGSLRNPLVLPLGPEAVTSQLVGIFERTLKLPGKLLPSAKGGSKPATSGK